MAYPLGSYGPGAKFAPKYMAAFRPRTGEAKRTGECPRASMTPPTSSDTRDTLALASFSGSQITGQQVPTGSKPCDCAGAILAPHLPATLLASGKMKKIRNWLSSPALPYVSAGLVVLLTLPALWTGFQLDDMAMRMALIEHPEAIAGPGEAFSFINGDLETNRQYMDLGVMPWWAAEDLRFVFLRPVTIAFHRLDYVLWPDSAPLMHLHSLLWLAALVLSVAALYRRLLSPVWIAGLATLLYAIDDAHGYPTAWLANRNALIATTLGVLALVCHDRWRRDRWRPGPWLASFYLALALFAAEFGAGTLAYLFAYVVFLEGRGEREGAGRSTRLSDQAEAGGPGRSRRFPGAPWSQRFLSLCPYAAVAAVWLIVYKVGGYGTEGSGFYVDPLRQPASFLWALFERGPVLLLGQWGLPQADVYTQLRGAEALIMWLRSMGMILLVVLLLMPLLRRSVTARFWTLGMLISLIPICATAPSNRLLFFTGIGGMALLAQFLGGLTDRADWLPRARPWRWFSWGMTALLLVIHVLLAPIALPITTFIAPLLGEPARAAALSLPDDDGFADQDLVIVSCPDHLVFVTYMSPERMLRDLPIPRHIRALSAMPVPVEMSRMDESSLRIRYLDGPFIGPLGRLWRGPDRPVHVGQMVELEGMTAEVVEITEDGEPREVVFRFGVPLEDASLRWVLWEDGVFVPFEPPPTGETVRLPAPYGPMEMRQPGELLEAYKQAVRRNASMSPGGSPSERES